MSEFPALGYLLFYILQVNKREEKKTIYQRDRVLAYENIIQGREFALRFFKRIVLFCVKKLNERRERFPHGQVWHEQIAPIAL